MIKSLTLCGTILNTFGLIALRVIVRIFLIVATLIAIPAQLATAQSSKSMRVQVVDERGVPVRDAVVEFAGSRQYSGRITFPWRMAMAQRNQQFVPGTLIIARGSTVAFPNLDKVRHSVYSFSKAARFEIDLYGRDQTRTQTFPNSGSVALGCNIHDAMRGYIRVVDTPFAGKTDANGYVTLSGMSDQSGKVTIWHPRLRAPGGELSKAVGAGGKHRIAVRLR